LPQTGRQKAPGIAQTVDMSALDYMNFVARHDVAAADTSAWNATAVALNRLDDDSRGLGDRSPFKIFQAPQDLIDDRGVIYIRQGPPDASAHTTRGESLEMWVYDRPAGPLILSFREVNFDGQAGASQLVPTLLTENPLLRDQLCYLKPSICSTNADPRTPTLTTGARVGNSRGRPSISNGAALQHEQQRLNSGALLEKEVDEGKEAIFTATTTDAYRQHFSRAVVPTVQIYGLDRAAGGAPRLIATFAIPGAQLASSTPPDAHGRMVYPVRIQLIAASRIDGTEYHLDTLRRFVTPRPLHPGEYLTGYVELPLPAGRYAASVTMTQEDGRGAIATLGDVVLPAARGTLAVTDIVLGRDSGGVRWNSGATEVAFNPLNTYRTGGTAEVYFQLGGLIAGNTYEMRFEFFRAIDEAARAPRMIIASPLVAAQSRMEISQALGLKTLDPGRYRVKLTVRGSDGATTSATGWVNLVKK
jgi:hypothetical protein